jgi:hypothetical protein
VQFRKKRVYPTAATAPFLAQAQSTMTRDELLHFIDQAVRECSRKEPERTLLDVSDL